VTGALVGENVVVGLMDVDGKYEGATVDVGKVDGRSDEDKDGSEVGEVG